MNVPVRVYPLRLVSEPRLFVAGERMGQRIPVQTPGPPVNGIGPVMSSGIPPATMTQTNPMLASGVNPMAMNTGLGLGIGAAQLTHQNRTMDTALASSRPVGPIAAGGYSSTAGMPGASSVAPNIPKPPEEDESGGASLYVTYLRLIFKFVSQMSTSLLQLEHWQLSGLSGIMSSWPRFSLLHLKVSHQPPSYPMLI